MNQRTIKNPQNYKGWGIIFQQPVTIRISQAPVDTGIVFNHNLSANIMNAFIKNHFVGLKNHKQKILFVEHFLSACLGLGIDNLYVEVLGNELPFGDGSALPYIKLLQKAEIKNQNKNKNYLLVTKPISVVDEKGWIVVFPARKLSINLFSELTQPNSSNSRYHKAKTQLQNKRVLSSSYQQLVWFQEQKNKYTNSFAKARTFGEYQDVDFLKKILHFALRVKKINENSYNSQNYLIIDVLGNNPSNNIISKKICYPNKNQYNRQNHFLITTKENKPSNIILPQKLRYQDELLRHKMLDLIGDLALLGKQLQGKIFAFNPSHKLNHKLVERLTELP